MKLKQHVVLLAILLVIFIFTKVFLIDNLDTSAANREDQRAFHRMMAGLRVELTSKLDHTLQSPWEIAAQWVVPREVYPEETPELGAIMHAMATKKIIKADMGYKGTQLKALLILEGGQKVVFKPKRYSETTWWRGNRTPVTIGTMQRWQPSIWTGFWVSAERHWWLAGLSICGQRSSLWPRSSC